MAGDQLDDMVFHPQNYRISYLRQAFHRMIGPESLRFYVLPFAN